MSTNTQKLLSQSLIAAKDTLTKFVTQSNFLDQLQVAFGDRFDTNIALGIVSSIKAGDWSFLPAIEIRTDAELAGNNGAFDTADNLIFANDDFLAKNLSQPDRIVNLLLEEIGHKFDILLNGQVDSSGDEGAIFAALAQGKTLSDSALADLKAEDDHTVLSIDGKQVAVELESWTASNPLGEKHTGTDADDTLTGGAGNDTIDGGAGNDLIDGGAGNNSINGGDGNDTLTSGAGNDTINGGAGNDFINGGDGNNNLEGGTGSDTLIGGAGNDSLNFRTSRSGDVSTDGDVFDGGGGINTAYLTSGTDGSTIIYKDINGGTISGGGSIKNIQKFNFNGGSGNDTVDASASILAGLDGGEGNDSLIGGAGNDILAGGDGNDTLEGGGGTNSLKGGSGDDVYIVSSLTDKVVENPDEGNDTVWANVDYTLADNVENMYVSGNATGTGNSADNYMTSNGGGNNTLVALDGNDTLVGGTGNDTLVGGAGNDIYQVHSSGTQIAENAGEGTDTVYADVNYTLSANLDKMYVVGTQLTGTGNSDDNYLLSFTGDNTLYGGAGNDILHAGTGVNTLYGGTGNDVYGIHNSGDVIVEQAGEGTDTVWTDVNYTLSANLEKMYVVGSGLTVFGNNEGNYIASSSGDNNTLNGGIGNDRLDSGTGVNQLIGGAGNDTYTVHNSATKIVENAGEGTDTVYADVNYTLSANLDKMYVVGTQLTGTGNSDDNYLLSFTGDNTLYGGAGNDILHAGTGVNTLYGGTGNDIYGIHNSGDVIIEYTGEGTDTVWTDVNYTLSANLEKMYLVRAVDGTGNAGDNLIAAYDGLYNGGSAAGNNIISGGAGNDTLVGGAGNDTYIVNANTDIGTKTIIEQTGQGVDTIDFSASTVDLKVDLSLTTTQIVATNVNLVMPVISLENVIGGAGNDTIAGNSANNVLTGGAGNDNFVFTGGVVSASTAVSLLFGSDTIADFTSGADKLVLSQSTFGAITTNAGAIANFASVTDDTQVNNSAAAIVYSQATGKLFYNADGMTDGFGDGGGQFATLLSTKPGLVAGDFLIV
jgi:trimeric autotransporter adhesin